MIVYITIAITIFYRNFKGSADSKSILGKNVHHKWFSTRRNYSLHWQEAAGCEKHKFRGNITAEQWSSRRDGDYIQ